MSKLRFAHLSDIHFSSRSSIGSEPDGDVRNELIRDLRDQVRLTGPITAVLVSGDIAFSGAKSEYDHARDFLEAVCLAGDCDPSSVFICPGNHDVDRSVVLQNSLVSDMHDAILRPDNWVDTDTALMQRVRQPEAAKLLYRSIEEFNNFAAGFGCTFTPTRISWDRDFFLNDGSTLRLRALNSTLTSGPLDRQGRLCIGENGWTMSRHDGVEYMVMAHHPPSWLRDGIDLDRHLNERARIHLFGHEHEQRLTPAREYVRLYAGSVNPERDERSWHPGYNLIDAWVEGSHNERTLVVEVRMREWSRNPLMFQGLRDSLGNDVDRSQLRLRPWQPQPPAIQSAMEIETTQTSPLPENSAPQDLNNARSVTHRFFKLSLSEISVIAGTLELFEDSDRTLPDFERNILALKRAKDRGKWEELTRLIAEAEARRD